MDQLCPQHKQTKNDEILNFYCFFLAKQAYMCTVTNQQFSISVIEGVQQLNNCNSRYQVYTHIIKNVNTRFITIYIKVFIDKKEKEPV